MQVVRFSIILLFSAQLAIGQSRSAYKEKILHLGILPGLGTNGINPGEIDNVFAFTLFTGYNHSTKYLEINGLSGFNTGSSSGIHISGLANFLGGNGQAGKSFKEKRKEIRSGYETNLTGLQFSGLLNFVRSNTFGAQFTLGINITANYLIGSQVGGVFNYVKKFTIGTQVSAIGNYSKRSMTGVQVAILFNATQGRYAGVQLGAINHAGVIGNIKGPSPDLGTAIQIGLLNTSGNMGGWQIGLVNIGKRVTGTQIGLINIFKNGKSIDYKDGPAFALLNFGFYANPRAYISELFLSNFGWVTGKPINSRVRSASRIVYSYNEIVYSTNYDQGKDISWGVSYKAGITSFSKLTSGGISNYFGFMGEIGHVNWRDVEGTKINLRYSVLLEAGIRLSKKLDFVYPFISVSYNYLPDTKGATTEFLVQHVGNNGIVWPGYAFGIMFH